MSIVNLTEKAIAEVHNCIKEQNLSPATHLRVGVTGGGCSGFKFVLNLDEDAPHPDKDIVEEIGGVKVVVDKKSALYLQGATVDWQDDLNQRGFKFDVPGSTGRCGCGSSFSM